MYLMNFILTGQFQSFSQLLYQHRCSLLLLPCCRAYSYVTLLHSSKTEFLFPQMQTFCVNVLSAISSDQLFLGFASRFRCILHYLRQMFTLVVQSNWYVSKRRPHSNLVQGKVSSAPRLNPDYVRRLLHEKHTPRQGKHDKRFFKNLFIVMLIFLVYLTLFKVYSSRVSAVFLDVSSMIICADFVIKSRISPNHFCKVDIFFMVHGTVKISTDCRAV